ncbi:putative PE-PGRS family protein [metagenome]|uniref:Putative PE-PGRS family protein n=1 Tax=metagenome TaxID=256318 RepID=A0A2P2C6N0_9ZZZZ
MRRFRGVWTALIALFLLPAVLLSVLRIVHPDLGFAVRMVSFTPLALGLYGFAALLAIGRLLLPGRGRWQVDAGIVVVTLVGLGLHAWWLSPQFLGSHPETSADAAPVRVLTVNLYRGAADAPTVVDKAVRQDVDLLVLQEISPGVLSDMNDAGLSDAFPYHAGKPDPAVAGTMVFATVPLDQVTRLATDFDSLAVTAALPDGDLRLFAVHPQPPKKDIEGWAADLDALAMAIADQHPDVVAGDFNATSDHVQFRRLLDAGTVDAAERLNTGWQPTWPANDAKTILGIGLPRLVQIDHVLIGPEMAATGVRRIMIPGSDHSAVLAEVARR